MLYFSKAILRLNDFFSSTDRRVLRARSVIAALVLIGCFVYTAQKSVVKEGIRNVKILRYYHSRSDVSEYVRSDMYKRYADIFSSVSREFINHLPSVLLISSGNLIAFHQYSIATLFAFVFTKILKIAVAKPRPDNSSNHSFPSGHAMQSGLGAAFMSSQFGLLKSLPLYVLGFLVCVARVYVMKHTIIDVVAGFYIGVVFALYFVPFIKSSFGKVVAFASRRINRERC